MTGEWVFVLVAAMFGLLGAEAGVRMMDKSTWSDGDYMDQPEGSGSLDNEDKPEAESGDARQAEYESRMAGSGHRTSATANVEDNKINFLSQGKKDALRKKAQDQRVKIPLKPSEVVINIFKKILEPFSKDDCLELVLCHMGKTLTNFAMLKMGVGMMMSQVPNDYYSYANAFVTGVMDSRCSYHCALLYPREEL